MEEDTLEIPKHTTVWELRELLIPLLTWVMKNGGHEEEGCPIHIHMGEKSIEQKNAGEFIPED